MDKKVLSVEGKEIRTIELSDDVFGRDVSDDTIYYAVRNELANRRVGTASTKTRSEVVGSHKKPWRQKGTGRARSGTRQSPVWVGGGIAFGPRPRDYSYTIPRKQKRAAIKSLLSMKNRDDVLRIVEDFAVDSGKTRDFVKVMQNVSGGDRVVLVLKDDDPMVKRAASNVPWIKFMSYNRLSAHELLYCRELVLMESAALSLNDFFARAGNGE
ncbi:MAG: 50S ribosomal protein L4 [Spirochaetaceae bacterium]|nr:MAG: 50S ribosomal protein L4 [Spirochaetaceae bacterium]